MTIGACGWNSGWVRDCFGDSTLLRVSDRPIICSGVSMGPARHMRQYFHAMRQILQGSRDKSDKSDIRDKNDIRDIHGLDGHKFPACERNGVDQGVHNVLVHSTDLSLFSIKFPHDFPVVNMQTSPDIVPNALNPRVVLTDQGALYAILHQYDRLPSLSLELAKQFVDWIDWKAPLSEWETSPTCSAFVKPLRDIDLFRGICDFFAQRVITPATCCDLCLRKNSQNTTRQVCTGFSFTNSVCYFKSCDRKTIQNLVKKYRRERDPSMQEIGGLSTYLSTGSSWLF